MKRRKEEGKETHAQTLPSLLRLLLPPSLAVYVHVRKKHKDAGSRKWLYLYNGQAKRDTRRVGLPLHHMLSRSSVKESLGAEGFAGLEAEVLGVVGRSLGVEGRIGVLAAEALTGVVSRPFAPAARRGLGLA